MPFFKVIEAPAPDTFYSLAEAEQKIYQHTETSGYALTRADIRKDKKNQPQR